MDGDEARLWARWIVAILLVVLILVGAVGALYKINQKFIHPLGPVSGGE
ncbi:MAG TPA: hypothetical protein VHQ47_18645 [Phycisphaerae bacterium]|jgi:hypothetical protein|nr:hypothetical protein [Phycisphaerae bacterium]